MAREKVQRDDYGKTIDLAALINLVLAPFWAVDARLGLNAAIAATAVFLYGAHEIGKNRRPIANTANSINSFFGDQSTATRTLVENIAKGGAVMFDEIMPNTGKVRR